VWRIRGCRCKWRVGRWNCGWKCGYDWSESGCLRIIIRMWVRWKWMWIENESKNAFEVEMDLNMDNVKVNVREVKVNMSTEDKRLQMWVRGRLMRLWIMKIWIWVKWKWMYENNDKDVSGCNRDGGLCKCVWMMIKKKIGDKDECEYEWGGSGRRWIRNDN